MKVLEIKDLEGLAKKSTQNVLDYVNSDMDWNDLQRKYEWLLWYKA